MHRPLVQAVAIILVIAAAVISRPIEARLWRAGRLSDRTTAILLVARFPIVAFLFAIIVGAAPLLALAITLVALLPTLLLYRSTLSTLREQRAGWSVTP